MDTDRINCEFALYYPEWSLHDCILHPPYNLPVYPDLMYYCDNFPGFFYQSIWQANAPANVRCSVYLKEVNRFCLTLELRIL